MKTLAEKVEKAYSKIIDALLDQGAIPPSQKSRYQEVKHKTPARAALAFANLVLKEPFDLTVFEEGECDAMVIQNGIEVAGLCEHHLLPFFGTATVAYLPNDGRIVGLSKLARLAKWCTKGIGTQERATRGIVLYLEASDLRATSIAVSMRCFHTCMSLRGVKDSSAVTTTTAFAGAFKTDPATRAEFLSQVVHPPVYQ